MGSRWSRRGVLAAASLVTLARGSVAGAAAPRVVALDWALAATTLALGIVPVGIAEQDLYRAWVREPALPAGIVDVGLRATPSFETLAALKPDLILVNALNGPVLAKLESVAPTFSNTIFAAERRPLARSLAAARDLGARLDRDDAASALVARVEARIAAAGARLAGQAFAPLLPLSFYDERHAGFYGQGSLYTDVLTALGLRNDFQGSTGLWGVTTQGIADFAAVPKTDVLVVAPVPAAARHLVEGQGLWSALLAARQARQLMLPPVWAFGDCTAAARFAELVAEVLVPSRTGTDALPAPTRL